MQQQEYEGIHSKVSNAISGREDQTQPGVHQLRGLCCEN